MAMIHGTRIEDKGFVGFAAQTMNGCVIEREGMLAWRPGRASSVFGFTSRRR